MGYKQNFLEKSINYGRKLWYILYHITIFCCCKFTDEKYPTLKNYRATTKYMLILNLETQNHYWNQKKKLTD